MISQVNDEDLMKESKKKVQNRNILRIIINNKSKGNVNNAKRLGNTAC